MSEAWQQHDKRDSTATDLLGATWKHIEYGKPANGPVILSNITAFGHAYAGCGDLVP